MGNIEQKSKLDCSKYIGDQEGIGDDFQLETTHLSKRECQSPLCISKAQEMLFFPVQETFQLAALVEDDYWEYDGEQSHRYPVSMIEYGFVNYAFEQSIYKNKEQKSQGNPQGRSFYLPVPRSLNLLTLSGTPH